MCISAHCAQFVWLRCQGCADLALTVCPSLVCVRVCVSQGHRAPGSQGERTGQPDDCRHLSAPTTRHVLSRKQIRTQGRQGFPTRQAGNCVVCPSLNLTWYQPFSCTAPARILSGTEFQPAPGAFQPAIAMLTHHQTQVSLFEGRHMCVLQMRCVGHSDALMPSAPDTVGERTALL